LNYIKRFDISSFDETTTIGDHTDTLTELLDETEWSSYIAASSDITTARKDFKFKQIPEDPFHYAISTGTPKIYGWFDSNYVFELTWDETNHRFTPEEAYPIPSKFAWDGLPEHIDFGHKRFVIMNYMNCDAVADVLSQDHDDLVVITSPSAQFFEYAMLSAAQAV
jgi:hypothetical protein